MKFFNNCELQIQEKRLLLCNHRRYASKFYIRLLGDPMKDLSEVVETINGILEMFGERPIDIDVTEPVSAQYQELHDKYLDLYFKKMPDNKKVYEKTGLVNDLGYHYLMEVRSKLDDSDKHA